MQIPEKIKIDLRSLFEFSKVVNQDVSTDFILNFLLLTLMGKLTCNRAIIFLREGNNEYRIKKYKGVDLNDSNDCFKLSKKYSRLSYINNLKTSDKKFLSFLRKNKLQFIAPIIYQNTILGYVALSKLNKKKVKTEETNYLNSIINITASALQQKLNRDELIKLNRELDHKIHQMNTLFELSKEFAATLQRDKLIRLLNLSLMGQLGISKFAVLIKENGEIKPIANRLPHMIDCKLLGDLCYIKKPLLTTEVKNSRHRNFLKENKIQAIVPLISHDEVKGFLLLAEKLNAQSYSQLDLEFLYSLSNIAIISIENTRLLSETIEKQKMEDELQIAKGIQQGLFPKTLPRHKNLDIAAINIPSKIVGGDYYDVFELGDEKFIFAIADVSGKGTPAALLMANIQAMFHTLIKFDISLPELAKRINELLYDNTSTDRFITLFFGMADMKSKILRYVNAGHNYPILLKNNGKVKRLDKGGLMLGVSKENSFYEEEIVQLDKGDLLCIFTDGITEAVNSNSVEFGERRLIKLLFDSRNLTSMSVLNKIISEVKYFAGENQNDDVTMIVVKVL